MNNHRKESRRSFVKKIVGGAAVAGLASKMVPLEAFSKWNPESTDMATRPLGKTGHHVRLFSLGGQATLEKPGTEEESIAIINRAIDLGVNYIDTAAAYGRGISETYLGKVMKERRKEVFLATKTNDRSYDGSMRLLEKSLAQLQTDKLDCWQLHNVRTDEDLKKIFADDGAIKAMEKAKDEKIVRFLGISGHYDPHVLRRGIEQYPFDTILMALNVADRHNASFIEHLLPHAVRKGIGIIGMKIPARGRMFREGGITKMEQAMRYVLTLPVNTVIVGITKMEELEENIRIAQSFRPYSAEEMAHLEDLAKPYYADASWFKVSW
ncbi:MAG: aldo/keto reductase [Ignavibacteria bacterium]|nr:aldo/keto reductase [Ignavibacteria bacterium]